MGAGVVLWGCFWSGLGQVRTGQRRDRQDGSRPLILLLLLLLIFFLIHPCSASYQLSFAHLEMYVDVFATFAQTLVGFFPDPSPIVALPCE